MTKQKNSRSKSIEEKIDSNIFQSIFENSLSGILYGNPFSGDILDANPAAAEMFDYSIAELKKLNRNDVFDFKDHAMINHLITRESQGKSKGELIGIRKNGEMFPCEFVSSIFINENNENRTCTIINDISQRKRKEHHLKLLESVITNTNDSVMITEAEPIDEPGPRIVYVNDAFTRMTGYSAEEVIGKSPRILQGSKTDKSELKRMKESMKKWKACEITVINYKKNGEEFWVTFSINPIADKTGWYTHWIAIERDVTQQKLNEQEREKIIYELSQNIKDLKQFSYVISHNLRAPIANLLGLTSLIDQYEISDKSLKQIIDGIKQSALIFDDTVKDLTKVLVIKDQTNIVKEKVSFDTVINNVISQLSNILDDNAISINCEFSDAPYIIFTNTYLESVFLNLFTNSIKYKSLKRNLKINISSKTYDDFVELRFTDNGTGIDLEKFKGKIFMLYQRFHEAPESKGLGLYLIKSQIETLGGTIDIASKVDVGTTFIIKFKK